MAKKRYTSPKYDQFLFRGKNLSKARQEWNTEMMRLLDRAGDWVRKFHAVADIPTKPDRATAKAIQQIKEMVWKKTDEPTKKQWRKEYEYRYENKMPEVYIPKLPYNPPTETDFINNNIPEAPQSLPPSLGELDDKPDEDGYTETVVSRDEIEAWIDANIYSISSERENEGAKELLEKITLEAADAYGDYEGYLNHLEANADRLNKLAEKAVKYHKKGSPEKQEEQSAIAEFATILNLGRPLTPSQAERLENEGWVSYDFND